MGAVSLAISLESPGDLSGDGDAHSGTDALAALVNTYRFDIVQELLFEE
ncbi:MAG: hypothetical protein GY801_05315 [bacterium]|nr:hypothetical protein [bacterium]